MAVTMRHRGPSPKPAKLTFAQQFQSHARATRLPGSGSSRRALHNEEKTIQRAPRQATLLPTRVGI